MSRLRRPLIALIAFLAAGCALFHAGRGVKSCRYTFHGVTLAGFDGAAADWRLDVGVANPNPHPVTLNRMRFTLLRGADTLLTGWNPEKRVLAPGDSQRLAATLTLPLAALGRLPPALLVDTAAEFTLVGDAYLDTWLGAMKFPGALHQTLHVNMPEQMARCNELFMRRLFGAPAPAPVEPTRPSPDDTL